MAHRAYDELVEIGDGKGVARRGRRIAHHVHRRAVLRPRHHRRARLDDAGLFGGDLGRGVPEPGRVVEPDAADNGYVGRIDGVRGIQPPAQAHFQHHDIAFHLGKVQQRHRGHQLEFRGVVTGFHRYRFGLLAHGERDAAQIVGGNVLAVYADTLLEALDVGAREPARRVAGLFEDARQIRARAALAVRPGNMDEAQRILRAAQAVEQVADAVEPQPRGLPTRLVDVGDGVERIRIEEVGRRGGNGSASAGFSGCAIVDFGARGCFGNGCDGCFNNCVCASFGSKRGILVMHGNFLPWGWPSVSQRSKGLQRRLRRRRR